MGLKLYPGSIKGQADSIIQNLEFDNKDLLSALQNNFTICTEYRT